MKIRSAQRAEWHCTIQKDTTTKLCNYIYFIMLCLCWIYVLLCYHIILITFVMTFSFVSLWLFFTYRLSLGFFSFLIKHIV